MVDLPGIAGSAVGGALGAVARLRGGKPMHPRGAVFSAVLERRGSEPPWGVPWLDATGTDDGVVRLSRGAGLPAPLPDLLGLAVRIPSATGASVDLLLSTTGRGPLSRLVPAPRRDTAAVHTSIMGYRSDAGILRLAALPEDDDVPSEPARLAASVDRRGLSFTLAAARGPGPWVPFGRLVLGAPAEPLDPGVRFDAVRNAPPGLIADGPMARFRAPAYARARRAGRDRPAGHAGSPGGIRHWFTPGAPG